MEEFQDILRSDLVPTFAHEQFVKVLTYDAKKNGARTWERGMKWSRITALLKNHLTAFEKGEDIDPESGLLNTALVAFYSSILTQYYKLHPHGDDRPHTYLHYPKYGLDIDDVIADFILHWTKHHNNGVAIAHENWNFDKDIDMKFDALKDDKSFWLSIPAKISPSELPFEPHCYITSRNIPTAWTEEWIQKNGFPTVPVYSVGHGNSKVEVAKAKGIEIFVDDRYENFIELNKNGICTFLMDAAHNQRYNVGYKRIKHLKEIFQ